MANSGLINHCGGYRVSNNALADYDISDIFQQQLLTEFQAISCIKRTK